MAETRAVILLLANGETKRVQCWPMRTLRIMAHLSGDERLLEAFSRGEDIHRHTASEVFGAAPDEVTSEQRRYAKVINFGLIYGMSAFGLASNLAIERSAAQSYMEKYFMRYPGVAQYMERTRMEARERGYVETVFGRRLWLPDIRSNNQSRRQGAERYSTRWPGRSPRCSGRAILSIMPSIPRS